MLQGRRRTVVERPEDFFRIETRRNFLKTLGLGGTIVLLAAVFARAGNISPAPSQAAVDAFAAIYAGEENTTQGTVNITGLSNLPSAGDGRRADSPRTR